MFCNRCGASVPDNIDVCPNCGNIISGSQNRQYYYNASGAQNNQQNAQPNNQQNYQQGQYYQPPQYNPQPYQYQQQVNINEEVSSANTLGIIAIVIGIFIPLVGWICGGIGLSKANRILALPYCADNLAARKARKLNIAGILVPLIVCVAEILLSVLMFFGILSYSSVYF